MSLFIMLPHGIIPDLHGDVELRKGKDVVKGEDCVAIDHEAQS
jgi:hypothetical protein